LTGSNNTVSRNIVNEACAGLLLGSGSGNTFPEANTFANVNNTTLAGDVCTPAAASNALTKSQVASAAHGSSPVRP
jgi:hypothetical protein